MGQRAIVGAILAAFLMAGCVANVRVEVETGGDDPPPTQEVAPPQDTSIEEIGPLTSNDEVCAARDAVVAALEASTEDWTAAIADETRDAPCHLNEAGGAAFGPWSMTACTADCDTRPMRFLYRREGRQVPSYAAEVVRRGGELSCTDLGQFLVAPTGTGSN